jgi:cyclophilin family peptidyl-prolyl cis-trans isomerase
VKFSRRNIFSLLSALVLTAVTSVVHAADAPQVILKTNMGEIVLELNPEKAPKSVANFIQYVNSGQYNGTIFHRVIKDFMIQGGGHEQDMKERPTKAPIENEGKNGLKNDTYTLAMARKPDPHSATAQFFINTKNNDFLNAPGSDGWGYAVFGKVVKGMDVVDKIKMVQTAGGDVPVKPVIIESATLKK